MVLRSAAIAFGIVAIAAAVLWYVEQAHEKEDAATKAQVSAAAETLRRNTFEMFQDQGLAETIRPGYRGPGSDWVAREKAFYAKLLSAGHFDVLVMPVLPRGYSFDRATRSLLTAQLAIAVEQAQHVTVADPFIVAKALGEGSRQFDADAAYKLANDVGAKRIIWTFAGHDGHGKMAVSIQSQDGADRGPPTPGFTPVKKADLRNLAIDEETSPADVFESLMPGAIKIIGGDAAALLVERQTSQLDLPEIPASPMKLSDGKDNPARDAYAFLVLAQMTPTYMEIVRERFAEKAFLATTRMSTSSPDWRVLRARAYLALGYRPAALKALGTPQTDEERALLALLNGNLTAMSAVAFEANPLKHLLQRLEINSVEWDYGVTTQKRTIDAARALKLPGATWPYLAARGLTGHDPWAQFENDPLKIVLESEFPVKGYALQELVRGSFAAGDVAKLRSMVDASVFDHARKFIDASAPQWCCRFSLAKPDPSDYMELLQAIGHDNLIRRIRFISDIQGRPEEAMSYANEIQAIYKDYPYYTLERARVERNLARRATGAAVAGLSNAAFEDASHAMLWEQSQSLVSGEAFSMMAKLPDSGSSPFNDTPYVTDIPYHPAYPTWSGGGHPGPLRANAQAALANSAFVLSPARYLMSMATTEVPDEEALKGLVKSMEGRFIGSPERSDILATIETKRGNLEAAASYYRESIQISPSYWDSYRELGRILFRTGEIAEAAKLFQSYPGFRKGSDENHVGIVNNAFDAGSMLYWSGHTDLAKPLYEIAARQNTGAAGEMTSALRLKLLAGDYAGAFAGTMERAQRYNEAAAYRDYLGMLHAMGRSAEAWSAFMVLAPKLRQPQIWETVLVGHRIASASEGAVAEWSQQAEFKGLGTTRSMPAAYLLRFATMDRVPSKDLSAILDGLDYRTRTQERYVLREAPGSPSGVIVGSQPAPSAGATPSSAPVTTRVKSDLAYFADAYRAIKTGDFAAAKATFDEAGAFYDMRTPPTSYMLPYRALAAAKAGDAAGIEAHMAQFTEADRGFDYLLAKAAIAAIGGRADEALAALNLARYRRPFIEERPLLTQYTYGEFCELLGQLTSNASMSQIALDWARSNEAVEPWYAWSYAMEAHLTKDPKDRQRAIAMLHYLDPKSERLAEFKKSEVEAAAKGLANPFLQSVKRPSYQVSLDR